MDRLTKRIALLILLACCAPLGCASVGAPAPAVPTTTRLDGTAADPLAGAAGSLVVLVFLSHECPIANAMAPDLRALALSARTRGVDFAAVHANTGVTAGIAATHAREFALEGAMEILLDPSQRLIRATGATVTPEGAVLRRDGAGGFELLYLGRVNDLYAAIGRRRARPTSDDLADAIDAALAGRSTPQPFPTAVGCFIERRP